jgi:hypothetical protein
MQSRKAESIGGSARMSGGFCSTGLLARHFESVSPIDVILEGWSYERLTGQQVT